MKIITNGSKSIALGDQSSFAFRCYGRIIDFYLPGGKEQLETSAPVTVEQINDFLQGKEGLIKF